MDYDRGSKFSLYREIDSLKEYVLISSTEYRFEKFVRQEDDRWLFSEVKNKEEKISIESIEFAITLNEFYRNVDFSSGDESNAKQ